MWVIIWCESRQALVILELATFALPVVSIPLMKRWHMQGDCLSTGEVRRSGDKGNWTTVYKRDRFM